MNWKKWLAIGGAITLLLALGSMGLVFWGLNQMLSVGPF